jgi:hypothetical protein
MGIYCDLCQDKRMLSVPDIICSALCQENRMVSVPDMGTCSDLCQDSRILSAQENRMLSTSDEYAYNIFNILSIIKSSVFETVY